MLRRFNCITSNVKSHIINMTHTITIVLVTAIVISVMIILIFGPNKFPFYHWYGIRRNEFEKKQWVRLLDILILGPFAIWLAVKLQEDAKWGIVPYLLYAYAYGTIVFNFTNYYQNLVNN